VVAGVNYKLQLQVLHIGTPRTAQATVWHPLDGPYQLRDWAWIDWTALDEQRLWV
jgi:hypothetical protein